MTRVLLCDDADEYRCAVAYVLSLESDLTIVGEAADGVAAVELARNLRPDVVLMDVGLPRLDGVEATRQIHAEVPDTRVLALTAYEEGELVVPMMAAGAVGFCVKGGSFEQLRDAVRAAATAVFLDERAITNVVEEAVRLYRTERAAAAAVDEARAALEREGDRCRSTADALVHSLVGAIETRDGYTADHTARVSQAALLLGERICPDLNDDRAVGYGYMLHDVGKLGVPDAVLHKPTPLTSAERAVIEKHVDFGIALLAKVPDFDSARAIVANHHERWDGAGYPHRLARDEIPLAARLFAVCDAYDAMTSTRPYRAALAPQRARAELERGRGTQFDPDIVGEFLGLLDTIGLHESAAAPIPHLRTERGSPSALR